MFGQGFLINPFFMFILTLLGQSGDIYLESKKFKFI